MPEIEKIADALAIGIIVTPFVCLVLFIIEKLTQCTRKEP